MWMTSENVAMGKPLIKHTGLRWLCCGILLVCAGPALAVSLAFGPIEVAGTVYSIPIVMVDAPTPASALNFALVYDPNVFRPAGTEPGPVAQAAQKTFTANESGPGVYTVLVYGINNTAMQPGVLGWVAMERISAAPSGVSGFAMAEAKAVSPDEVELGVGTDLAQVAWGDPDTPVPPEPEDPDPEEDEPEEEPTTPEDPEVPAGNETGSSTGTGTTVNTSGLTLDDIQRPGTRMVIPGRSRNTSGDTAGTADGGGRRTTVAQSGAERSPVVPQPQRSTTPRSVRNSSTTPAGSGPATSGTTGVATGDIATQGGMPKNPQGTSGEETAVSKPEAEGTGGDAAGAASDWKSIAIAGVAVVIFLGLLVGVRKKFFSV